VVGWNALTAIGLGSALPKIDSSARTVTKGVSSGQAGLEDVAAMALLAGDVSDLAMFRDQGVFRSYLNSNLPFGQALSVFDSPVPSGNSMAIRAYLAVGLFDEAVESLRALSGWMERAPSSCAGLVHALVIALQNNQFDADVIKYENRVLKFLKQGWKLRSLAIDDKEIASNMPLPAEFLIETNAKEARYQLCNETMCLPWQTISLS
jgi:uncharacterized protein YyaL (SSP411 family)